MSTTTYKSDNIIVGGGLAGIVTALELLDLGQKVLLLDRDIEERFGGLAKLSFGGMFFVDTPEQKRAGIKDSVDIALKDWFSVADFGEKDELPKKWAEQYVNTATDYVYQYLKNHKIKFFPFVHWVERGLLKRGNSYPRFHMVWGTGAGLSDGLRDNLLNHPKAKTHLQIHFNHRVEEILTQNDTVIGVKGKTEDTDIEFEAYGNQTIIAAGGLGGDIEQVKSNWHKDWGTPPKVILNGAHPFADGLLHRAVERMDGKITHLDLTWPYAAGVHHPRPTKELDGLSLVPPRSALWFNHKGKRFGPMPLITSYDTRYLVDQICAQEKKYSWQIMNMKIMNKELAISGSEFNPAFKNKSMFQVLKTLLMGNKALSEDMINNCPDFVTGNSVEELVENMNALTGTNDVDLQTVKNAITEYDKEVDRGHKYFVDEQLCRLEHLRTYTGDRVRMCKFAKINDQHNLPLVAIREFILSRKTLGGMQTDLKCRILSNSGEPINGLYAVGEAAGFGGGGMHGKGTLEGTFLGACVLTGRIAAHDIVGKSLL
ncbi:MAG: FAD-binding dehydrogenase [Aureispira sp.]|nr:FAD-binding dehydrogenase [Aureispira sp.]